MTEHRGTRRLLYFCAREFKAFKARAVRRDEAEQPVRKKVRGIERSTFVIDEKGKLAREWRGVKVPGPVEEVLSFAKAL